MYYLMSTTGGAVWILRDWAYLSVAGVYTGGLGVLADEYGRASVPFVQALQSLFIGYIKYYTKAYMM